MRFRLEIEIFGGHHSRRRRSRYLALRARAPGQITFCSHIGLRPTPCSRSAGECTMSKFSCILSLIAAAGVLASSVTPAAAQAEFKKKRVALPKPPELREIYKTIC